VRVRAGIEPRPLLTARDLPSAGGTGLIVVGSYVDRTTQQLDGLLAVDGTSGVQLSVGALLANDGTEVARAVAELSNGMTTGRDVVLYTSRELVHAAAGLDPVAIGARITTAVCDILARLDGRPGFLIVKGGSTAHGIATRGLGMTRAVVLGQLLGGVPVWQLGPESKYPDLPYVVFPGNVGGPGDLAQAVRVLKGCDDARPR
jgi:uncharacterized protein YgbK (DUF1537 family)